MSMGWKVLALILRARANMMRAILNKRRKGMKLYCFLFPSDFEFDKDTLVQLWIAVGFSRQMCGEEFCRSYFDYLLKEECIALSRIDLLTGRTMYKVVQDKVTDLSEETRTLKFTELYTLLEDESSKSRHISVVSRNFNETTFEKLNGFEGELRTLLFIHNYGSSMTKIPSDIFLTLQYLRALDLSGSHITELPISVGNLRELRYLDLSSTLIESLPESISGLGNLQTLKLLGCIHLFELPIEITRLFCLRHLYFDVLGQLTFLPKGIGGLTELRTLSAFIVDCEEGCSIRELKNMNSLTGSLCVSGLENVSFVDLLEALQDKKHLTHLQLRWNNLSLLSYKDELKACDTIANVILSTCIENLQIINYPGLMLPNCINLMACGKLVSITLFNCENQILLLSLGLLPNLKYLTIVHMNRVAKIENEFRGSYNKGYAAFPKLEKLEINCMFSLETWKQVYPDDFQHLSKLTIKQCPKLVGLPFLHLLRSLKHLEISHCSEFKCLPDGTLSTSLENLIIDECSFLKKACSKEGEDWHKISHVPNIWIDLEDIQQEDGAEDNDSLSDGSEDENMILLGKRSDNEDICSTHVDATKNKHIISGIDQDSKQRNKNDQNWHLIPFADLVEDRLLGFTAKRKAAKRKSSDKQADGCES